MDCCVRAFKETPYHGYRLARHIPPAPSKGKVLWVVPASEARHVDCIAHFVTNIQGRSAKDECRADL
jgi:hypothetical protein